MAANWGTIDLTGDSNDECPPPNLVLNAKPSTAKTKTPIPLPENVHHLYPPIRTPSTQPGIANRIGQFTNTHAPTPTSASNIAQRSGNRAYRPVKWKKEKTCEFDVSRPEKRQKLTTPAHAIKPKPNTKPLSIQSLNAALDIAPIHLPGDGVPSHARTLQIVRADDEVVYQARSLSRSSSLSASVVSDDEISRNKAELDYTNSAFGPRQNDHRRVENPHLQRLQDECRPVEPPPALSPIVPPSPTVPATVRPSQPPAQGRPRQLRDEENDLLIYLKEVKNLKWKDITAEFNESYPGWPYTKLQSHYSSKLNRRDRTKDPPRLRLPPRYAHLGDVDMAVIHSASLKPAPSKQAREVSHLAEQRLQQSVVLASTEYSSGAEQARRRHPRRAVPVKNYTWPRRNQLLAYQDAEDDDFDLVNTGTETVERTALNSEDPSEALQLAPEKAIAVDNEPVAMDFDVEDAQLALSIQEKRVTQKVPYLSIVQRSTMQDLPKDREWDQLCSRQWQGQVTHVDFSPEELAAVEQSIFKVLNTTRGCRQRGGRKGLQRSLQNATEPQLLHIADQARKRILSRDAQSMQAFLQDAKAGQIRIRSRRIERLTAARPNKSLSSQQDEKTSITSIVRQREIGLPSRRGWNTASRPLSYQMKNKVYDTLGPAFAYTGASSDVHALAWSPDGQCFAGGAICVDDDHSMQYNRPNNLLYGDVTNKAMHELGRHRVPRPRTHSGPNSTHAMYVSLDPNLYKTVTSVAFSPDGRYMFSGGYDNMVCVWEAKSDGSQPDRIVSWRHKGPVDILAVNISGVVASATKRASKAIKALKLNDDDMHLTKESFQSAKATSQRDQKILPTALQFSPLYENLLLAGFGANARSDGRDTSGDICLWDINSPLSPLHIHGTSHNVFDLVFHSRHNWFAIGCVAGGNVNRGTRSVLRLYDGSADKYTSQMELECKALDMNDVVWCPGDDNLIAAGCTDGCAYIWDIRRPDNFLWRLQHANSLIPLDPTLDRETTDTGIRFLSWGDNAKRLYTGSSDGVVKVWNVKSSGEENFIKDLISTDSGIMSGAFSPDNSRLILGEVNGSINVLEVGREDCSSKDVENFKFHPYIDGKDFDDRKGDHAPVDSESGVASASELLAAGQMKITAMGCLPIRQAVQGPLYTGPFDRTVDAPFFREQALAFQLTLAQGNKHPQCTIHGCDDIPKITSEETGDSGRSADRIPDELRLQWKAVGEKLALGKAECTVCKRAARPCADGTDAALCERCSFSCFRCGAVNAVPSSTESFICAQCDGMWDIGVLGYNCSRGPRRTVDMDMPSLKGYAKDLIKQRMADESLDDDASYGDEMNALTDYYLGLAIDWPVSPPL